jgi:hypothetical protein
VPFITDASDLSRRYADFHSTSLRKDIMKSVHSALALVLSLAMVCNLSAASASPHSGTSPSYKSGFSSQKSNSARSKPAPPPAGRQSGPGAFGKAPGSPASAQPQRNSSMSHDMDQSAARANALKTLDARRAAAAQPPPLPPVNDTVMRPQPQPAYQTPPPVYQGPAYQQPSSGLMHGLLGFMLGRAMSQSNQPVSYPTASQGQSPGQSNGQPSGQQGGQGSGQTGGQADGGGMLAGMPGLGAPVPASQAPAQSFGASVLRWFIWLGVLSVMAWAVVYAVRKLRRLRAGNTTHYSFERN